MNGKARAKGKQKHRRISRDSEDPNAPLLLPKTQKDKENARKEKISRAIAEASEPKISTKKKRRIEKYIDKKLRKEERVVLFEKLAQSQASSDSLKLRSSSSLGSGRPLTYEQRFAKAEDLETRRDMDRLDAFAGGTRKRKRTNPLNENSAMQHSLPASQDASSDSFDSSDSDHDPSSESSVASSDVDYDDWTGFTDHDWGSVVSNQTVSPADDICSPVADYEQSECGSAQGLGRAQKAAGFKNWALKQLAAAKGYEPVQLTPQSNSEASTASPPLPLPTSSQNNDDPIKGPLGEVFVLPSTTFAQLVRDQNPTESGLETFTYSTRNTVAVERSDEVQTSRLLLPILAEEQPIMEAILLNPVLVICGETGSGKTTQVPQFLYEAGFGSPGSDNPGIIGVTQPRRVAAVSMASRVATELSLPTSRVSYQIRYDATVSPTTSILFMTDGVLLRELANDLLLSRYSVIIVDEAHERSMNTDILIGVLSRVVRLREQMWKDKKEAVKPLRLIIMSATLRVSDFTANPTLFPTPPPVINIPARQHPVTVHFSRRTVPDYVTEAVRKTIKIHSKLPPGGILVFLTGQNEIKGVCKKLEDRFGRNTINKRRGRGQQSGRFVQSDTHGERRAERQLGAVPSQVDIEPEDIDLGPGIDDALPMDVFADVDQKTHPDALESDQEPSDEDLVKIDADDLELPMHVVPLYSMLSSDKQMDVFKPPPSGARLVVVSTNIAETSITIPGIRYVVDCGRAKERKYDIDSGIQSFQVSWISKASAAQRAGRAGRTGPGHCYRLYSSALFESYFEEFARPEILRVPIEGVVLQMKSMNIDTIVNFPFPTPPDRANLKRAETVLRHLEALDNAGHITNLGRTMALFPVSPRFSKMLVLSKQLGCLPYIVTVVSVLSIGDPFLHEEALIDEGDGFVEEVEREGLDLSHIRNLDLKEKEKVKSRRRAYFISQQVHASLGRGSSDVFRALSVVGAYEYAGGGQKFCAEQFVRPKAMEDIHKLRQQMAQIVEANFPDSTDMFVGRLRPPDDKQLKILRQVLTAGFIEHVAVRKDIIDKSITSSKKYASSRGVPYKAIGVSEDVFIHPSSALYHVAPPDYVVFYEVVRTSRSWIKTLTVINPAWLPKLGPTLCTFSKPSRSSPNDVMVIPRYGPGLWELPPIKQRL